MSAEDTPLVIKSDEEFPAKTTISFCVTIKGMGTDRYRLPTTWQNLTTAPVKKDELVLMGYSRSSALI